MKDIRFVIAVIILLSVGWLVFRRGNSDVVVSSEPLSSFPALIDGRSGIDQTIDPESLEVLGSGEFLERVYSAPDADQPAPGRQFLGECIVVPVR